MNFYKRIQYYCTNNFMAPKHIISFLHLCIILLKYNSKVVKVPNTANMLWFSLNMLVFAFFFPWHIIPKPHDQATNCSFISAKPINFLSSLKLLQTPKSLEERPQTYHQQTAQFAKFCSLSSSYILYSKQLKRHFSTIFSLSLYLSP